MRFSLLAAMLCWLAAPGVASGQDCLDMHSSTLMYTEECTSQPTIDRAFGGQTFVWQGLHYLIKNIGNDLKIWLIDTPASPAVVDRSYFWIPNVGDSDYDLLNFSVCDDCRWGVANFKAGTVLFDLGVGALPDIGTSTFFSGASLVPGAFTFKHAGHQYLIAATLGGSCTGSGLARITGTEGANLSWLQCLEAPGVASTQIVGGFEVGDHLYLGDKTTRVFVMRVIEDLGSIYLEYVDMPFLAYMIKDKGLAVDFEYGVAVVGNAAGMSVWDISDPGNPIERGSVSGDFNRAAVRCQYAWVAKKGFKNSEQTFDISDRANPQLLDQAFWDPAEYWNYPTHQCAEIQGGTFSPDASTLYLSRYSMIQMVNFAPCGACQEASDVFSDGFESGSVSRWSLVVGGSITP